MYICISSAIYLYIHRYNVYIYGYVCTSQHIYTHVYIHIYIYIYMKTSHVYVCIHVLYIDMYICVYIYIYVYMCIYIYIIVFATGIDKYSLLPIIFDFRSLLKHSVCGCPALFSCFTLAIPLQQRGDKALEKWQNQVVERQYLSCEFKQVKGRRQQPVTYNS